MDIKRNINQRNKIFRKSAAFTNKIDVNFENVDKLIGANRGKVGFFITSQRMVAR